MADTTYIDYTQPAVNAEWLNEINDHVWHDTPITGTTVHDASVIKNTPAGSIAATTIQTAINELDTEKVSLSSLASSSGSSLIGFIQSGTGTVATTLQTKVRESISVKDFGAVGDGVTDDTAAMQLAHNTGLLIYYPAGTYLFTNGITITSGGIIGDGSEKTILKSDDNTSANLIIYNGNYSTQDKYPRFQEFKLLGNTAKTVGAGIRVAPSTGEASYLLFSGVVFYGIPVGIDFIRASLWKVIGCDFLAYRTAGILVANENDADSGDSVVSNCVFNNPYTTGSGILQYSSGGLKIIGNKFLGGDHGYELQYNSIIKSTSVLIISANSIENMTRAGIVLQRIAGSYSYTNIIITGNEFGVGPRGIQTDGAAGLLTQFNVTGNIFNISAATPATCVELNAVTDFIVADNVMRGNGGTSTGVAVDVNSVNGKIGINTYSNLTATVNNLSTTTEVTKVIQRGSSTTLTSGWTAYGTLYQSANVTVSFPRQYNIAPTISDIKLVMATSAGEVGYIIISVSTTQFVYRIISAVTSIAATSYWTAEGIL